MLVEKRTDSSEARSRSLGKFRDVVFCALGLAVMGGPWKQGCRCQISYLDEESAHQRVNVSKRLIVRKVEGARVQRWRWSRCFGMWWHESELYEYLHLSNIQQS